MPKTITNKFNLPQTIVDAVAYDTHVTNGTISCTELIDSPQIRLLKKNSNYTEEAYKGLYALMGTAMHHILERSNASYRKKKAFVETAQEIINRAMEAQKSAVNQNDKENAQRLQQIGEYILSLIPHFFPETKERYIFERNLQIKLIEGHVLSLTLDLYDQIDFVLYDYKYTSVYSYIFPESRNKWNQQTNIYAYGLHTHGFPVHAIKIVAMFRDWSKFEMMRSKDYPRREVVEIPVTLGNPNDTRSWTEQVEDYILKRIKIHIQAEKEGNARCTGEERWAKPDEWAVFKAGGKRAVKRFLNEYQAEEFIKDNAHKKEKMHKEYRPGGSRRCEDYCPVADVCPQWAEEKRITAERLAANED